MDYKIKDRLEFILDNDKMKDPQYICEVLKDELQPIVNNYINLQDEIKVKFKKEDNKNKFLIEIDAERIKPFGYIPN